MSALVVPRRSLFSRGSVAPGGGGGAHPNEPAGMTVLSETDWSAGLPPLYPSIQAGSRFGIDSPSSSDLSIITPTTKPFSSTKALRFAFHGAIGGGAPNTLTNDWGYRGDPIGGVDELYADYYRRHGRSSGVGNDLTGPWDDNGNAGTKFGFVWTEETGANKSWWFDNLTPLAGVQMETIVANMGVANPAAYGFGNELDWYFGAALDDGSWERIQWHAISNTGTSHNGRFRFWVDGTLKYDLTDVKFFPDGVSKRWNQQQISPTYGGGTNPVPAGLTLYMDVGPWYMSGRVNGIV